jgi:rubrerythrin
MSAGKGDQPRPVNGDRYRANYEAIFAKEDSLSDILEKVREQLPYPAWICRPCGEAHGRGMPAGHASTWHEDPCGVCGKVTSVSEPRDFGHLKKWPILPKNP